MKKHTLQPDITHYPIDPEPDYSPWPLWLVVSLLVNVFVIGGALLYIHLVVFTHCENHIIGSDTIIIK